MNLYERKINSVIKVKKNFEYNFELIFNHEKQNLDIQDIDFSVHFVVVALVQMVPKKV